jgi:hypothetical protein
MRGRHGRWGGEKRCEAAGTQPAFIPMGAGGRGVGVAGVLLQHPPPILGVRQVA